MTFIAAILCVVRCAGGYLANSLAIMTDAAHMLSDVTGFAVSLLSIWIALIPPTKRMPFGWHRAGLCVSHTSMFVCVCPLCKSFKPPKTFLVCIGQGRYTNMVERLC